MALWACCTGRGRESPPVWLQRVGRESRERAGATVQCTEREAGYKISTQTGRERQAHL